MSASGSSVMFFPHMLRSSIHCRPKSCATTEQTWSKSCEISSLMTATWKGQAARAARAKAAKDVAAAAEAMKLRREMVMGLLKVETGGVRFRLRSEERRVG